MAPTYHVEQADVVGGGEWSGVMGVSCYRWRQTSEMEYGQWRLAATLTSDVAARGQVYVTISALVEARQYRFRVQACNDSGAAPFSAAVVVATHCCAPLAPTELSIADVSTTTARLSWRLPTLASETGGVALSSVIVQYMTLADEFHDESDWATWHTGPPANDHGLSMPPTCAAPSGP